MTAQTTMLATASTPSTNVPPYIVIPGTKRVTSRRTASNPATGIKAIVIPDRVTTKTTKLKVSLMREQRVLYSTLIGHEAPIVDLEFLQTSSDTSIHVLGSCDRNGVVFLWFLYVAVDNLGNDYSLDLIKKYSFFTLRRSTTAFYWRIRLAGTVHDGTMVLVPNDGTNVRVVTFHCETQMPEEEPPLVMAQEQPPLLAPPLASGNDDRDDNHVGTAEVGNVATEIGGTHSGSRDLLEMDHADVVTPGGLEDDRDLQNRDHTQQRNSIGLDDLASRSVMINPMAFEASGHPTGEETLREHGVSSRSTMNSSVVLTRADGATGTGVDDLTDELAEAAATAAGVPVTEMEGALEPAVPPRSFIPGGIRDDDIEDDDEDDTEDDVEDDIGSDVDEDDEDDEYDEEDRNVGVTRPTTTDTITRNVRDHNHEYEHDYDDDYEAEPEQDDEDEDDEYDDALGLDYRQHPAADYRYEDSRLNSQTPGRELNPRVVTAPPEVEGIPADHFVVEGEGLGPTDYTHGTWGTFPSRWKVTALTTITVGLTFGGAAFLLSRGNKLRPCEVCGGMGSWKCVICDGKGYVFADRKRSQCKACVGRGRRLCRECNASGWNKRSNFLG